MWWALGGAILIEVVATLSLRASDGFRKKGWIVPVTLGYLASFYLLWLSLSQGMPVGIAYGIWTKQSQGHVEVAGLAALILSGGLLGISGSFFWFVSRRIDARPEDRIGGRDFARHRLGGQRHLAGVAVIAGDERQEVSAFVLLE